MLTFFEWSLFQIPYPKDEKKKVVGNYHEIHNTSLFFLFLFWIFINILTENLNLNVMILLIFKAIIKYQAIFTLKKNYQAIIFITMRFYMKVFIYLFIFYYTLIVRDGVFEP